MKKLAVIIVIIFLLILIKNLAFSLIESLQSGSTTQKLTKELTSEQKKNTFLKEQLNLVRTKEFVEQEAREKLGLVRPNEKLVVLRKQKERQDAQSLDDKQNWQKWWNLFF